MNKKMNAIKTIRIIMIVLLVGVFVYTQFEIPDSDADISSVARAVTEDMDMENVELATNRMFKKFYGLNANDYDGIILYTPVTALDAEEILIIKLEDRYQSDEVVAAIEERLTEQKNIFDGYRIEQYALLENAVVDVRGNYILYVVHPEAEKADVAFRRSL